MRKLIVTAVIASLLSGPAFAACEGDVQAQEAANAAWREEAYHRAQQNRRDGNLSVWFAAQDWNGAVGGGRNPNPTGGPVGASIGGSD
jgi:hypothetical protein